ncbi:hypothetical protein LTS18_013245 [Coniosporium uncinatum]|uniref:Uncharacterized protein n=1 Tax=Coniosporium uncinatum TaxID=93489 RepID=A0ACC3CWX6_9PEZI|nr:hypothetical protein LTS18_013245 [Coniosporium uncinatum]
MTKEDSEAQRKERQKNEAILEALADERVVDEESFQRAVRARQRRALEDEEKEKLELAEVSGAAPSLAIDAPPAEADSLASTPMDTPTTSASEAALLPDMAPSTNAIENPAAAAAETAPTSASAFAAPELTTCSPKPVGKPTPDTNGTANKSKDSPKLPQPKRWAQDEGAKEYPISTERAEAIARWVREAPLVIEGAGGGKKKKRSGKSKGKPSDLAKGMSGMSVATEATEEGDEEVD